MHKSLKTALWALPMIALANCASSENAAPAVISTAGGPASMAVASAKRQVFRPPVAAPTNLRKSAAPTR